MFCLAGIGGRLSGSVQSARNVLEMVVIDGCSVGCAEVCPEPAQVPASNCLVMRDGIDKVKEAVKGACENP